MHSGYPIVTHLDVASPSYSNFLFSYENYINSGSWGIYHEIGHNFQRSWWTYSGTG